MCIADLSRRRQHDPLRAAPLARGEAIPVDSPLSRLALTFVFLAACVLFCARSEAHPVAQGALEIVIFPERVLVRATVSNEEVLVAATAGRANGGPQQLPYSKRCATMANTCSRISV